MKREDIKTIFPEATDEQLDLIMGINGADIESAKKERPESVKKAKARTDESDAPPATSPEESTAFKTLAADFEAFKQQIEADKKSAQEAKERASAEAALQKRFNTVSKEAKWMNDHVKRGVYSEFIAAFDAPEHKGKTDKEIYTALTTDKEGYFQNPNPPADGIGVAPLPGAGTKPKEEPKTFF